MGHGWASEQTSEHILYFVNWFFENQNHTIIVPQKESELLRLKQGYEYDYRV